MAASEQAQRLANAEGSVQAMSQQLEAARADAKAQVEDVVYVCTCVRLCRDIVDVCVSVCMFLRCQCWCMLTCSLSNDANLRDEIVQIKLWLVYSRACPTSLIHPSCYYV